MYRYVVFQRRDDTAPADLEEIGRTPGLIVVDHETASAMLIEADDATVESLRRRFPKLHIARDVIYPLPDTE